MCKHRDASRLGVYVCVCVCACVLVEECLWLLMTQMRVVMPGLNSPFFLLVLLFVCLLLLLLSLLLLLLRLLVVVLLPLLFGEVRLSTIVPEPNPLPISPQSFRNTAAGLC